MKKCKWNALYKNTFDGNKSNLIKQYLYLLKKLNLIYFLGFGSELGAVRNGGLIKRDHDIDIIIPIWMNYKIFKCNEYISYFPRKCYIYSNINVKVCNKTKHDYMIDFKKYVDNKLKIRLDYKCRLWGQFGYTSCWSFTNNTSFLDFWILIGTEYFYQHIKICRCYFSMSISFCNENSLENIKKMYGDRWMIPIKHGHGATGCSVVLYPHNNNSVIKYTKID